MFSYLRVLAVVASLSATIGVVSGQEVIANGPFGSVCTGPLGNGPCADVMRFLQQHPGF